MFGDTSNGCSGRGYGSWTPPAVLALLQGLYYFGTGVWPLFSIRTFQMITGPKTDHLVTGRESDHWLVMTVGALIAVIGLVLLVGGWRRRIGIEVVLLAIASAAGLAAIDVIYVARQVLSPIYLADATAELVIVALWALLIRRTGDHQAFGDRT